MAANSTLLRLFSKKPKSPLLVVTSPCAKFNPRSTGNRYGKNSGRILVPPNLKVSQKSKMAACIPEVNMKLLCIGL